MYLSESTMVPNGVHLQLAAHSTMGPSIKTATTVYEVETSHVGPCDIQLDSGPHTTAFVLRTLVFFPDDGACSFVAPKLVLGGRFHEFTSQTDAEGRTFWFYHENGQDLVCSHFTVRLNDAGTLLVERIVLNSFEEGKLMAERATRIPALKLGWTEAELADIGTKFACTKGAIQLNQPPVDCPDSVLWNADTANTLYLSLNTCLRLAVTPALTRAVVSGVLGTFNPETNMCLYPLGAIPAVRLESTTFGPRL
jgi:hypothetical protein